MKSDFLGTYGRYYMKIVLFLIFLSFFLNQSCIAGRVFQDVGGFDYLYDGNENIFENQVCSLFNAKPPVKNCVLLDFVKKYDLNFGYSCCCTTLPDSLVLYNPNLIFDLFCGDSINRSKAMDSLRALFHVSDNHRTMRYYYLSESFPDPSNTFEYSELKIYALEKIIHATVAYELFSKISDPSLLKTSIDFDKLNSGSIFTLDLSINDYLFNDTLYSQRIFDAYIRGTNLSGNDSLINLFYYFEHFVHDKIWYAHAATIPFWNFILNPYRDIYGKDSLLNFCRRISVYDSLNEPEKEFLCAGSEKLLSESLFKKLTLRTRFVLDSLRWKLESDSLHLISFDSTEFKTVSEGLLKLLHIGDSTDSLLNRSVSNLLDVIKNRINDSILICNVFIDSIPQSLTVKESSQETDIISDFKQYGSCREINTLAINGNIILAGTGSGLIEIDKKESSQKYHTPLNSPLKSHRMKNIICQNNSFYIVSGSKELVTYDGKRWQSYLYDGSLVENSDELSNVTVNNNGTIWVMYPDNTICRVTKNDTLFIDHEKYPFFDKNPDEIVTDAKGNTWFKADNVILCNNTKEWITFDSSNTILPGCELYGLCCDSSGSVWTSCRDVLYCFDGNSWKSIKIPEHPLIKSSADHLAFDKKGTLWLVFNNVLVSFDFKKWRLYPLFKLDYIRDLAIDNDNDVWLATNSGLWVMDSNSIREVDLGNSSFPGTVTCRVIEDRSGDKWIGGSNGVAVWRNGQWTRVKTPYSIDKMIIDKSGKIFASSHKGYIYSILDTVVKLLYNNDSYYDEDLNHIAVDSSGQIWACFDYHSVRFADTSSIDTIKDMPQGRSISEIMVARTGDVWVSVNSFIDTGSAVLFRNGTMIKFGPKNSRINDEDVKVLCDDSKNNVWFSVGNTSSSDLIRYDGRRWKKFDLWYILGLYSRYISSAIEDKEGQLWVGTEKGLVSWDGKSWWIYPIKEGVWSEGVRTIFIDKTDTMWITSGNTIISGARTDFIKIRTLAKGLKKERPDSDHWYYMSEFTYKPDSALFYINKAISMNKKDPSYYLRRAEVYHYFGKYNNAMKDMEMAVSLGDTSLSGQTLLGEIWYALGDRQKAFSYSNKVIKAGYSSVNAYIIRGQCYYDSQSNDSAFSDFTLILSKEPKKYPALYALKAKLFLEKNQIDSVSEYLMKAEKLDTTDALIFRTGGEIYLKLKQYEKAINNFCKAIKIDPEDTASIQNRGFCYFTLNNNDSALSDFNLVIKKGHRSFDAYSNRGAVYLRINQLKKAKEDLEKAMELDSSSFVVVNNYLGLLITQKSYSEYVKFFNTLPPGLTQNSQLLGGMGLACFTLKKYETALSFYDKAIAVDSTNYSHYYNKACVCVKMKKSALAIQSLEKSIQLGFNDFDHLAGDSDLDSIRNTEEFIEMIGKYRK